MSDAVPGRVEPLFRQGARDASAALSRWLGRPATIAIKRFERLRLEEAAGALGAAVAPVCAAAMSVSGGVRGALLLACADDAGLALCDSLLERPSGSSTAWGEVERSALLETTNIVGCSYLGGIAAAAGGRAEIVPSPPFFIRDFAAAVMDGLLLEQAATREAVFLARTEFVVDGTPIRCALIYLPDADGLRDIEAGLGAGTPAP